MKKVLILADNLVVADRIFSAMKGIVSCDFDFVVCKKNRLKLSLQYFYHNP